MLLPLRHHRQTRKRQCLCLSPDGCLLGGSSQSPRPAAGSASESNRRLSLPPRAVTADAASLDTARQGAAIYQRPPSTGHARTAATADSNCLLARQDRPQQLASQPDGRGQSQPPPGRRDGRTDGSNSAGPPATAFAALHRPAESDGRSSTEPDRGNGTCRCRRVKQTQRQRSSKQASDVANAAAPQMRSEAKRCEAAGQCRAVPRSFVRFPEAVSFRRFVLFAPVPPQPGRPAAGRVVRRTSPRWLAGAPVS